MKARKKGVPRPLRHAPRPEPAAVYDPPTRYEVGDAADCLAEAFRGDPMMREAGASREEIARFSRCLMERSCGEGHALVARDKAECVIGAVAALDWVTALPCPEGLAGRFAPVLRLLQSLDAALLPSLDERSRGRITDAQGGVEPGRLLRLFAAGVLPGAPDGVAAGLTEAAHDRGRAHKFLGFAAAASGTASRDSLAGRFGYQEAAAVDYREFDFSGRKVFAGIPEAPEEPCTHCRLLVRFSV